MSGSVKPITGQYVGEYENIATKNRGIVVINGSMSRDSKNRLYITIYTWHGRFYAGTVQLPQDQIDATEWQAVAASEYGHTEPLKTQTHNPIVHLKNIQAEVKFDISETDDISVEFRLINTPDTHCRALTLYHNRNPYSDNFGTEISWATFRDLVTNKYCGTGFVFRGQPGNYRIRSSYHRTGNADIQQYENEYLPDLRRHIVGIIPDFDLKNGEGQNLAMLTLLQHHGYPTPVIDWTESPYIAAFFAYSSLNQNEHENARVIAFDLPKYKKYFDQIEETRNFILHASFFPTPSFYNPRAIPQQSISCLTTIDDVERYFDIMSLSKGDGSEYVKYYSLSGEDRDHALAELEVMGITHASMFPGLDGLCRHYRNKHFNTS